MWEVAVIKYFSKTLIPPVHCVSVFYKSKYLLGMIMLRVLIIIAVVFITTTSQKANAQSRGLIDSMITCLHDLPLSTNSDGYTNCTSTMAAVCSEYDPPGGFGDEGFDAESCFISVVEQVKSKMNSHITSL